MASCGNKIPKSLTENLQPNLTQPYNTKKTKNNFRKRILSTIVSQSYESNTSKRYPTFLIVIEFPMTNNIFCFLTSLLQDSQEASKINQKMRQR